jgi:hypothetical protein
MENDKTTTALSASVNAPESKATTLCLLERHYGAHLIAGVKSAAAMKRVYWDGRRGAMNPKALDYAKILRCNKMLLRIGFAQRINGLIDKNYSAERVIETLGEFSAHVLRVTKGATGNAPFAKKLKTDIREWALGGAEYDE